MTDKRVRRELNHFLKTYKPYIPGKFSKDDMAIAFVKGFNAADLIHRGKDTLAEEENPNDE